MDPITEHEIRSSFINCSKGAAQRLAVPVDLADRPWGDLDFLGWSDPGSSGRCYLVVPEDDHLVGLALRHATGGPRRAQMCTLCLTTHTGNGVALMAAARAGAPGRRGDTVGIYTCSDLACSLYARGKRSPAAGRSYKEDVDPADRAARIQARVAAFITRVR